MRFNFRVGPLIISHQLKAKGKPPSAKSDAVALCVLLAIGVIVLGLWTLGSISG